MLQSFLQDSTVVPKYVLRTGLEWSPFTGFCVGGFGKFLGFHFNCIDAKYRLLLSEKNMDSSYQIDTT